MIDNATLKHLNVWVDSQVISDDREYAVNAILSYLAVHNEVLDRGDSWGQIYNLAKRGKLQ